MRVVAVVVGVLALCAFSAFAGLTAGINLNPQSTVRFVPDWGSVGDWVSGVGALLAVIASLYMVQRSERFQLARDSEQVMLTQEPSMAWLTLHIACKGMRSCTVMDLRIGHGGKCSSLKHALSDRNKGVFPSRLEPGEMVQLDWSGRDLIPTLQTICNLGLKNTDGLYFEVVTGISLHRFGLDTLTLEELHTGADAFDISLTKREDGLPF